MELFMPPTQAVGVPFEIHLTGEVTGKTWDGKFRAKEVLSFRDKLNADRFRRELIGDAGGIIDSEAAAVALVVSQLSVRLTEAPEWWKESRGGLELEDPNILQELHTKALAIEAAHMKKVDAEGTAAQTALRGEKEKS